MTHANASMTTMNSAGPCASLVAAVAQVVATSSSAWAAVWLLPSPREGWLASARAAAHGIPDPQLAWRAFDAAAADALTTTPERATRADCIAVLRRLAEDRAEHLLCATAGRALEAIEAEVGADSVRLLAHEVQACLRDLVERLAAADQVEDQIPVDGMDWLDAHALDFLERVVGQNQRHAVDDLRATARLHHTGAEPWRNWFDPTFQNAPNRFVWNLTGLLWGARVQAQHVRNLAKLAKRHVPALAAPVVAMLSESSKVVTTSGDGAEAPIGSDLVVSLPAAHVDVLERLPRSLTAHRLVRWLVARGFQNVIEGEPDCRRIDVPGGFAALAQLIGAGSKKAEPEVAALIDGFRHFTFHWRGTHVGGLLTFTARGAANGRQALLRISLGDVLLPDFTRAFDPATRGGRDARVLVPVLGIPPLVTPAHEQGAQAAFQLAVVAEMRRRALHLLARPGIYLPMSVLTEHAERVGLSRPTFVRLWSRWLQGADDGGPFLREMGGDQYLLTHAGADAFLRQAAVASRDGHRRARSPHRRRTLPL